MKFEADYELSGGAGRPSEKGRAAIALSKDGVGVSPACAQPVIIPWEETRSMSFQDYGARMGLRAGAVLTIGALGYKFEDFARRAARLRNEKLITLSLAEEPLKKSMIEAELAYTGPSGDLKESCELRIYETSLVAMPETRDFLRLPLRCIREIKAGDYTVEIISETGETWRLTGLGRNYDHFLDSLRGQMAGLDIFVQKALGAALAGADALTIRALAVGLREGRLVSFRDIERIMPGVVAKLEKSICFNKTDAEKYLFLKKISDPENAAFGIKKGLMGSLSGDHYIFVFRISEPGPAAAVESFLIEPGAAATDKKATYFYSLPKGADDSWEEFLGFFNKAMTAVNFRRMPVLLSEARLSDPRYALYSAAVERVPELRALRGLYLGRAMHGEHERWTADVSAIIQFASRNTSPGVRWKKNGSDEDISGEESSSPPKEN